MKQRITLQLRQVMIQEMEPEIQEKIRVREIEILDGENKVVARIGAKDGVYEDFDDRNIITILDNENVEVFKIGNNSRGGRLIVLGSYGSVHIQTGIYGGIINIIHVDGDDRYRINISARSDQVSRINDNSGFLEIHNGDNCSIVFTSDMDNCVINIKGKNEDTVTAKDIFKIGG